jgi:hypothetical protein
MLEVFKSAKRVLDALALSIAICAALEGVLNYLCGQCPTPN